jgi:hypothetical protein
MSGAFPDSLKNEMKKLKNEYHLEAAEENSWYLFRVTTARFNDTTDREPFSFAFNNPYGKQALTLTLQAAKDTRCRNITIEMDKGKKVSFPVTISAQQILVYDGKGSAVLYDKSRNKIKTIPPSVNGFEIVPGAHTFTVDAELSGGSSPQLKIELKTVSDALRITGK